MERLGKDYLEWSLDLRERYPPIARRSLFSHDGNRGFSRSQIYISPPPKKVYSGPSGAAL
jgi:hypothetical protein